MTRQTEQEDQAERREDGENDSPEIPDRGNSCKNKNAQKQTKKQTNNNSSSSSTTTKITQNDQNSNLFVHVGYQSEDSFAQTIDFLRMNLRYESSNVTRTLA